MFASHQQQKRSSNFSSHAIQPKSNTPFFQRKPKIGPANDSYEQEADRVADAVVSGEKHVVQSKGISQLQRKCAACENEEAQKKSLENSDRVQPQMEEEEEEAQPKLMQSESIQREEEEEAAQPKLRSDKIQRQEEEEAQTKLQSKPVDE